MRNRFDRFNGILYFLGILLLIAGLILLLPIVVVAIYWGRWGDGWGTVLAFVFPAVGSLGLGILVRWVFPRGDFDLTGAMLGCVLGWIIVSAIGAVPFVLGIGSNYLNAYFEAMSGFTTTGITVFSGLDDLPRSILFWRSLTQWLGGTGILSLYLMVMFGGGGIHHIFGAESHKIASGRPAPGLFNTLKIVWGIYSGLTLAAALAFSLEGMPMFDSICHACTALSTGGFSPHDASIEYYRITGHPNVRLIEYTVTFFMLLGGINFLVHYRVLRRDFGALRDNVEIRTWWQMLAGFTVIIMLDHFFKTGGSVSRNGEEVFRTTLFQVVSLTTTTGFGTKDIASGFFPALSRQLFLVMMFIGGCVGSTGGGFKVLRIAILNRLVLREVFKLRVSDRASTSLIIDQKEVPRDEILRVGALFFAWIVLLLVGGGVTAILTNHDALTSVSGMFSALGNIGPCYISVQDMIGIHPAVKVTYIFGMLAGRLEILPVLLLFSRKAWR